MAIFVSPNQPSMLVMDETGVLATFHGGQCVTDDPRALEVLAVTPGVRRVGEDLPPVAPLGGGESAQADHPGDTGPAPSAPPKAPAPLLAPTAAEPEDAPADGPPPQSGPGSSKHAWRTYAREHQVAVPDDVERLACIDACRRAGVRVD